MLAGLMIPLAAKAQTQALMLHHADGSTTDVELYTEPKITFSTDKVFIRSSVLDMEWDAVNVLRFSFKGRATGVKDVTAAAGILKIWMLRWLSGPCSISEVLR